MALSQNGYRRSSSSSSSSSGNAGAHIETSVVIAPFAQTDRRNRSGRSDRRTLDLQHTLTSTFSSHLLRHLYPRSTISISLHVISADGGVLAACINAASLALVDAGVAMPSLIAAVTSGIVPVDPLMNHHKEDSSKQNSEPILDLNNAEELELPFLTAATVAGVPIATKISGGTGGSGDGDGDGAREATTAEEEDKIASLQLDSRLQLSTSSSKDTNRNLEAMLAVALDGSKQIRTAMEDVVRKHGERVLGGRR